MTVVWVQQRGDLVAVRGGVGEQEVVRAQLLPDDQIAPLREHLLGALQVYASPVLPADGLNMAPLQAVIIAAADGIRRANNYTQECSAVWTCNH